MPYIKYDHNKTVLTIKADPILEPVENFDYDQTVKEDIVLAQTKNPVWGWCTVQLELHLGPITGRSSWLGGCSYEDERAFRRSDYYRDLMAEAEADLQRQLNNLLPFLTAVSLT
jgi:hypothetical protein